jgi:tape measure domain-containing protein
MRREVQLVIRAKNEADRALKSFTTAIDDLKTAQDRAAQSALDADASIGKLGAGHRNLERIVSQTGAAATRAMGQIEKAIDKASGALSRQEGQLAETRAGYEATIAQMAAARAAVEKIQVGIVDAGARGDGDAQRRLVAQLKAAERAYQDLEKDVVSLTQSMSAQDAELVKSSELLGRLKGAAAAAQVAMREYDEATEAAETSSRELTGQIERQSKSHLKNSTATTAAAAGTHRLAGGMASLYGESRKAMSITQRLRGEVLALITAHLGLYNAISQIGEVVDAYRAIEAAQNRLGVVFQQNTGRVAAEMQFLREQASRLGVEFGVLSREYSAFAFAAGEANFENAQTREVFLSLTEAGRVFNLTTEDMSGIFRALVQIMSKGRVQAEELRGQLGDRLSGAFQIMAAALGVTSQELDEMLERGEVIANSSTLLNFAGEMRERFGPQLAGALETVNTEIGKFQNNVFEAKRIVGNAGFIAAFSDALEKLNEWFQSDDGVEFFTGLGELLGRTTNLVVDLAENADTLLFILHAFAAVKLAQVFLGIAGSVTTGLSPSLVKARADVAALTASLHLAGTTAGGSTVAGVTRLNGVILGMQGIMIRGAAVARTFWAAIGGWPAVLVTALSFIVTSFLGEWVTRTDDATAALRRHEDALNRVRSAYVEARGDAEALVDQIEQLDRNSIEIETRNLRRALQDARRDLAAELGDERFGGLFDGFAAYFDPQELRDLQDLVWELDRGEITAAQFAARMDELVAAADNPRLDRFRDRIESIRERAVDTEEALAQNEAMLRLIDGTATDGDRALLGLADALEEVDASSDPSGIERYTAALRDLEDAVPDMRRINDFADRRREIIEAGALAEENAGSYDERQAVIARRQAALDALRDEMVDSVDYGSIIDRVAPAGADAGARAELEVELRSLAENLARYGQEVSEVTVLTARLVGGANPAETMRDGDTSGERAEASGILGLSEAQVALDRERARIQREINETQSDYNQSIDQANASRRHELTIMQQSELQQEIANALYEAEQRAQADGVKLSADRRNEIISTTRALYLEEERLRALVSIEETRREIARARGEIETREAFITRQLIEANVSALSQEGRLLAETLGILYDINEQRRQTEAASNEVSRIEERRRLLLEEIAFLREQGEHAQADILRGQLEDLNVTLLEAIDNAIAFWEAMGGPDAENAIARLEQARRTIEATGDESVVTGRQIEESIANGAAQAADRFAQRIADGQDAISAMRDSFLEFASDFLRQIAQMIIKQLVLNLLQSMFPGAGGGIAGIVNQAANAGVAHDGGVVGNLSDSRAVSASLFANAIRYHSGGIAGLAPNEVPTILEKGEEVLTEDDPRHVNNGGGGGSIEDRVQIINAIDSGDFVSKGLSTPAGQRAFINFIRANKKAVSGALS